MTWAVVAYWTPLAALAGCGVAIWWIERRLALLRHRMSCLDLQRQSIDVRVAAMDERARDFSRAIGFAGMGLRDEAVMLLKRWEAPEDAS